MLYGLRSFVSREGLRLPGCATSTTLQVDFLLVFWASDALSQLAKKEGTVLRYVIDPNYQGEIWLFSQNGDKEEYVQSAGDFLGSLLELPCPVIKVSGNLRQPNPGRRIKDPDISDIKHASPLQVKYEDLLESLLRAEEIQKYRMGSRGWHIYIYIYIKIKTNNQKPPSDQL